MPRAPGSPSFPSAAAKNVSSNAGHSEPSCSTPAYQQAFRPVTRSMTRIPPAIAASPDVMERVGSTSSRQSTSDACFSIHSAASRPTVTRVRTPHGVTKSAWKPLTQPAVLSKELKRASIPTANPTAKRSRVASSQAAKDSASKANQNVRSGKKNRNEECVSQGDQLDGAVIPSPPKKLHSSKRSSDVVSKRKSTIRSQGANLAAPLLMGKAQTEIGTNSASVLEKVASANTNDVSQSVVPLPAQQLQLETAKDSNLIIKAIANGTSQVNQSVDPAISEAIISGTSQVNQSVAPAIITEAIASGTSQVNQSVIPVSTEASASGTSQINQSVIPVSTEAIGNRTRKVHQLVAPVITEAIGNRTHKVNRLVAPVTTEAIGNRTRQIDQLVAPVITLPRQHLQTDNQKKFNKIPMPTNQVSGPAGTTGPLVAPKLQIGNVKDSSNVLSNPAYTRALLIKQQEQLLQQYKLANSQPQLHIKGPALFEDDDVPTTEPLGTRCALCKLDVTFWPQGDAGQDGSAPPVVAVLACHHAFHSSCIEAVYGLSEPSQCLACLDSATGQ